MESERSLIIGATGLVGGYIVEQLIRNGHRPLALSRSRQAGDGVDWFQGDLERPETIEVPNYATLYCTANAILLPRALPHLFNPSLKRVVVFTSTSVLTKIDSEIAAERVHLQRLADAEQTIAAICSQNKIGWTILRPTLIYTEGRDTNITPLSKLIKKFGFMPIVGGGSGLRQPVHAQDLATAAISAASRASAINKIYSLPGGETLTYSEMIGRIFDGLAMPRRIVSVTPSLWRAAFKFAKPLFPNANAAMGIRMMKDMTFDATPAKEDLAWNPRKFHPRFDQVTSA